MAIGQPQIRYSDPSLPARPCSLWFTQLQCFEIANRVQYPRGPLRLRARYLGGAPRTIWLVNSQRSTLRGRIEGGQGVGQWGVARAWQALRLLDKPTRAVPSSFLSVFDPQPKSAPARSQNSSTKQSRRPATSLSIFSDGALVGLSACHLNEAGLLLFVPVRTARAVPSKPRPGGAFLRPTGMEVPRKFGVSK